MNHSMPFTPEEIRFIKSLLLQASFKAEQVPHGPWKSAIVNNPHKINELWDKFHILEHSKMIEALTPMEQNK